MIKRDFYLNQIIQSMWDGQIKVITGLKRSGKSVLLFELFKDYLLKQNIKDDHILSISLDQRKYYKYRNPITLCDYVEAIVSRSDQRFYLFIDEVQLSNKVIDEENGKIEVNIYDMLNELNVYKNLDVYVTGSNSKMLSSDIMTEFRGRSTQIHVYPLSFQEYFEYMGGDVRTRLEEYLLYGGMPRITAFDDDIKKQQYLKSLYDEVYLKDIVERNHIKKADILEQVLDYLSSQIGSLTNPNNIANVLSGTRKEKTDSNLISSYIDLSINAFLVSKVKRFDIKGKSYLRHPNKYYFTDLGLRNARLNFRQYDPGHLMENAIYNDLLRQGYLVDVGVVKDRRNGANRIKEIDFVVNNGNKRTYIQSALRMDDESKAEAELSSLKLTNDFFKKIVVRNDINHDFYDDNGFYHCSLIDFLLGKIDLF